RPTGLRLVVCTLWSGLLVLPACVSLHGPRDGPDEVAVPADGCRAIGSEVASTRSRPADDGHQTSHALRRRVQEEYDMSTAFDGGRDARQDVLRVGEGAMVSRQMNEDGLPFLRESEMAERLRVLDWSTTALG